MSIETTLPRHAHSVGVTSSRHAHHRIKPRQVTPTEFRTVNLLASIEQATPTEFDPQGSLGFDRRSRLRWSSEAQVVGIYAALLRRVLWQLLSATLQPALK